MGLGASTQIVGKLAIPDSLRNSDKAVKFTLSEEDVVVNVVHVCNADELKDGEMKPVTVGANKIVVCRVRGEYYAVSDRCTHYNAPLSKGVLYGDRIMCPWHGACYQVSTGDMEDAPALNHLHKYQTKVLDNKVLVHVPDMEIAGRLPLYKYVASSQESFVIVGGGCAGMFCAEHLRSCGFSGRVIMLCKEDSIPYDRTKVSKTPDNEVRFVALNEPKWYKKNDIDLRLNTAVVEVSPGDHKVVLKNGDVIEYDKCLIACGTRSKGWNIKQRYSLSGLLTLREAADMEPLVHACRAASNFVMVGGSFIALEAASWVRKNYPEMKITIICRQTPLFMMGEPISQMITALHTEKNITIMSGCQVMDYQGNKKVESVLLDNGEVIAADVVLLAVGVEAVAPNFVRDLDFDHEGMTTRRRLQHGLQNYGREGMIPVDEYMKTSAIDVFAAGDCVSCPIAMMQNQCFAIKHWNVAMQQGKIAALNMLGANVPYTTVPFFWTQQFGLSLRYAGCHTSSHELFVHGSLDERKFVVAYHLDGRVTAMASLGRDPVVAAFASFCASNLPPTLASLQEVEFDMGVILRQPCA